jgi:threonine dehydrogenase-like Zn-dependent dehydrogenase
MSIRPTPKRHLWVWLIWLAAFYSAWGWLVFGNGQWDTVRDHWPIALSMALGSFAAGSTPMGGGTIGLACFFALKYIEQCEHVELYDLVATRVAKAIELGAAEPTDVIAEAGDADSYGGLYSGRGYDAIFETTASPLGFRRSVDLLRPLGTIMALGFIPSVEFSLKTITLKAAHVMGSMGGTGEFETVLDFTLKHPDAARQIITHKLPVAEYATAFESAEDRRQAMKVLITC